MNEMTESGEKAKGKGGKKADKNKDNDISVEGQVSRMLVRAIWAQDWIAAHPEGQPGERKDAWKEARSVQMETRLKPLRRAIASLKRSGVVMSITPATQSENDEDPGEDA